MYVILEKECVHMWFGKKFNAWHYLKSFQPNSFIMAMLLYTIDLYKFMPLSVAILYKHIMCNCFCFVFLTDSR